VIGQQSCRAQLEIQILKQGTGKIKINTALVSGGEQSVFLLLLLETGLYYLTHVSISKVSGKRPLGGSTCRWKDNTCIVIFHLGRSCTAFVLICTVVVLYCFVMLVPMCVCVCVYVWVL
jgi:hypothetical protein